MHLRVIVLFFKAETHGSSSQDVDQLLKLHGDAKANGEPPTLGSSNGAQVKERNSSQSPEHDDAPSNHVRHGSTTQKDSVTAETQDSAGDIGTTNSSSESTGSFRAVHDKGSKNSSEGTVNNGEESKDCKHDRTQTPNEVSTHSNSLQSQTSSQSVKESSGSEENAVDSSPGPQ